MKRLLLLGLLVLGLAAPASAQIALDVATDGGSSSTSPLTFSHTVTGSNPYLVVGVMGDPSVDMVTGCTYNSVSMTQLDKIQTTGPSRWMYLFGLAAPATGAHNVVCSASASALFSALSVSYTGVNATGQPDSHNTGTANANPFSVSTTVVASNTWLVGVFFDANGFPSASTGTTQRVKGDLCGCGFAMEDSNAIVGTGTQSLTINSTGAGISGIVASLVPQGGGGGGGGSTHRLMLLGAGK